MNRKEQHDISRKLKVLNYAKENGNIAKTCRYFGICREMFYTWKRLYEAHGEQDSNTLANMQLKARKTFQEKLRFDVFSENLFKYKIPDMIQNST